MDLKKTYDKLSLGIALVALLVVGGLLAKNTLAFGERLGGRAVSPSDEMPPIPIQETKDTIQSVQAPSQWSWSEQDEMELYLFSSQRVMVDAGGSLKVLVPSSFPIAGESIPLSWFEANQLDFLEGSILQEDLDGDGFTNQEEFLGQTDPRDETSHPPNWEKLVLEKVVRPNLSLELASIAGSIFQFKAEVWFQRNPVTGFLKPGDTFPRRGQQAAWKFVPEWTFVKVEKEIFDGQEQDVATLERIFPADYPEGAFPRHAELKLPKGQKVAASPEFAVFQYLIDGQEIGPIAEGQTFTIPMENSPTFLLKKITPEGAELAFDNPETGESAEFVVLPAQG
ncbi:MAG: Amuc_1099 family pilus-like system protein [Verrucomicrobiota bacterium]